MSRPQSSVPPPTCRCCGKPAKVWERNEDGSYTHAECAIAESRANGYHTLIRTPKEAPET